MSNFTAADVKKVRVLTGAGMMDCKKALEESGGDFDKAVEILRIKGAKDVGKRAGRATAEGLVAADGGVMVELNCETDFVAKNDEFQELPARTVAAAKEAGAADVTAPKAAKPADVLASERRIAEETAREEGKPEQALPKIVEGRVNGFYKDVVLLEQASVQESKKTVKALLDEAGVTVTRFARFEVGQA